MTTQQRRLEQFKQNAPEVYNRHVLRRVPAIQRRISELNYKMAVAENGPKPSSELEWMEAEIAALQEEWKLLETSFDVKHYNKTRLKLDTKSAQEAKPIL